MQKTTEKEIRKLVTKINGYRERVGKNAYILEIILKESKNQNRYLYYIKYLHLKENGYGVYHNVTPIVSGQILYNYLRGILEGIQVGIKITTYNDNTNGGTICP